MGLDELRKMIKGYNSKPLLMQADKGSLLSYYAETGRITEDEAEAYGGELSELPDTTRGLTIAYSLLNVYDLNRVGIDDLFDFVKTLPHSGNRSPLRAIDHFDMTAEEFTEACMGFNYDKRFEAAATFVGAKRRRLRGELSKLLRLIIAYNLSEELPEGGMDFIPYLRDMARENGYRDNAESLNAKDIEALDRCTSYYLDTLELMFLNGIGDERYREYTEHPEDSDFIYRDEYDEAMASYDIVYLILQRIFYEALNGYDAQELGGRIRMCLSTYIEGVEIDRRLSGTKFNVFLEGCIC